MARPVLYKVNERVVGAMRRLGHHFIQHTTNRANYFHVCLLAVPTDIVDAARLPTL
jgi:hypothetical protein